LLNTSNTGLPDSEPVPPLGAEADEGPQTPRERAISALLLLGAAALILLALFAGFHAVSILTGVLYPPNPPVYDQMKQVAYEYIDQGVDNWRYVSDSTPEQIAAYYTDHGAQCAHRAPTSAYAFGNDGRVGMSCEGQTKFSIFNMAYQVLITPEQSTSVIILSRDVFWIGAPAAPTGLP
jgi:hypothetical protein